MLEQGRAMADDATITPAAGLPDHVPPGLVFDYEQALGPTSLDDIYAPAWRVFEDCPPVFFAPSRTAGSQRPGSWVCSRYEEVREVFQNSARYSSEGIF